MAKAKLRRQEVAVITAVRAAVEARDGHCRLLIHERDAAACIVALFGACHGRSEWAHLGDHRRSKTRGLPPNERHTTGGSLMLCDLHHDAYDAHAFDIDGDAEGPLRFTRRDTGEFYQEAVTTT